MCSCGTCAYMRFTTLCMQDTLRVNVYTTAFVDTFTWPQMHKPIVEYTESCDLYQRVKDKTSKTRLPTVESPPPFPFHTLMLDFCGPIQRTGQRSNDLVVSMQCILTKRVRFIPCKTGMIA